MGLHLGVGGKQFWKVGLNLGVGGKHFSLEGVGGGGRAPSEKYFLLIERLYFWTGYVQKLQKMLED